MSIVVTVLHVLACFVLIVVVLLQTGKGADIGAVFGGSSQTIFGSSGAGNLLTRLTTWTAVLFMLTSLFLTWSSTRHLTTSIADTLPAEPPPLAAPLEGDQAAPAGDAATSGAPAAEGGATAGESGAPAAGAAADGAAAPAPGQGADAGATGSAAGESGSAGSGATTDAAKSSGGSASDGGSAAAGGDAAGAGAAPAQP
jgi:preprotein translocase subunit SecG